ncbi:MAG: S8 family serine peptidase [Clostridiales bacterium]|nr:S8 family serine peptidase [Clostridiales bacterium]
MKKFITFISVLLALSIALFMALPAGFGYRPEEADAFSFDRDGGKVEKALQDIGGQIDSAFEAREVTYEVYAKSDEGRLSASGSGKVLGEEFKLEGLRMQPGENQIVVTLTDENGKQRKKDLNINYEAAKLESVKARDVQVDKDGFAYADNNLLIFFDEDTDDEGRQKIVDSIGGKRVGYIDGANMWQVHIARRNLNEIDRLARELIQTKGVFHATCNRVRAAQTNIVIPDDPWGGYQDWNEFNPNGRNWSLEAIQALSAWEYDYFFNHIKVAVVDSGIEPDHEDLIDNVTFPDGVSAQENTPDYHGIHVAGIMAATANNNKGVTGILWDTTLYSYDWDIPLGTDAHLYAGLTKTVQAGAKVANFSLGLADDISGYGAPENNTYVKTQANNAKAVMVPLLNAGFDFLVFQSAGNGVYRNGSYYSVDARYNGYFCSVSPTNLTGVTPSMAQAIFDRIVVVGSAQRTGVMHFTQANTSNAGPRVDICAPGVSVYSAYSNNSYASISGTSMASPVAAATAALAWSVNPELTGPEVKNIIKTNTSYTVLDNTSIYHPLVNTYPMVNAKLAVEAAINTLDADYSGVEAAIARAEGYDQNNYTPASWAQVTQALNSVIYGLGPIEQPYINEYATNINSALDNLILKTVPYTVEYRLGSENGEKLLEDKPSSGQVTKTVVENAPTIEGYEAVRASISLKLELEDNKIIFVYVAEPTYGAQIQTFKKLSDGSYIPVSKAEAGDTVKVVVTPQSNFYVAGSKFVVMYDQNFYSIVGNGTVAFTPNGDNLYYKDTVTSVTGNTQSTPAAWPTTFSQEEKDTYKFAFISFTAGMGSANGGFPNILDGEDWLFSFELKVKDDAQGSGRIFMDHRWTRTSSYPSGNQYFYACADAQSPNSSGKTNYNFIPQLEGADINVELGSDQPPTLFDSEGELVPDENGFLDQIELGTTISELYVSDNYYLEIEGEGSEAIGTGKVVKVFHDATNELVAEYIVVVYGDINGDGSVDSNDASAATDYENSLLSFDSENKNEFCYIIAGDLNKDGSLDSNDASTIVDMENSLL